MAESALPNPVSVRLSAEELYRLDQLADIDGTDRSSIIRRLIREASLVSLRIYAPPPIVQPQSRLTAAEWLDWTRSMLRQHPPTDT